MEMKEITVEIYAINPRRYIKQWPNVPVALVPQKGDRIVVHFGDDDEEEFVYEVKYRQIDGLNMNKITVYVQFA